MRALLFAKLQGKTISKSRHGYAGGKYEEGENFRQTDMIINVYHHKLKILQSFPETVTSELKCKRQRMDSVPVTRQRTGYFCMTVKAGGALSTSRGFADHLSPGFLLCLL